MVVSVEVKTPILIQGKKDASRPLVVVQESAQEFLRAVQAKALAQLGRDALYCRMAEVVFAYWAAKLHHPQALLDNGRERRIARRLEESEGDWGILLYAVDGASRDDYLMGRESRSTRRYDGIETIFRDRAQVERLAEACPKFRAGEPHPLVLKYQNGNGNGHA